MTGARSRRQQHATSEKAVVFLLICLAPNVAAAPAPLASQPAESPQATTTADARTASTRYHPVVLFSLDIFFQSKEIRTFPVDRASGTRISECCPAKAKEHGITNIHESCTFAALQDALLPKPVSGKLQPPPLVMKHRGALHQSIKVEDIP